ncbi:hypothetical protein GCM10017744_081890 [Streptomyces antimycoticus]|uniref:Uncharacterized protein n=1 Tax=Streptomyces antimycoticus TaxID=68175 RepID=A0A4D4K574_9ACTN|nr:hypothetical protein SANT12839_019450 [Streptomyces antimycoticus]
MLVYPSGPDLASSTLRFLTTRLREHRQTLGTRWPGRRLTFAVHARIGRRGERDRDHGGVRPSAHSRHAAMSSLPGARARR